ncbi:hypothetical protein SAMN05421823_101489 [Catalinimonas alkaloidigena]|uniref:Uncharacterized protein n=1 Tax=Catalinimonas alkaloidigena TaxID=1075417 RepID=A0A1G8XVL8_9BACT|nr:hypothetical protein [Catalinimonas alkaloidigena]SDJ94588.1 hypothetical protein SAMN05421823_101489 [Catalinimonas alkaloidigena]
MRLSTFLTVFAVSALWGCRSQQIDLRPTPLTTRPALPHLTISLDEPELQAAYGTFPGVLVSEMPDTLASLGSVALKAVPNDPRLQDARVLLRRQLLQVSAATGEERGFVEGHVAGYQHYWRGGTVPLFGASLLSFGTLNLIGLPSHLYRTMVDVEVEVFDRQHRRIGYYQAVGEDAYATGLFFRGWGDHRRYSNAEALRDALVNISEQMARDADRLRTALSE